MTGKFITFEGPDGSGKSTVIKAVEEFLKSEGYNILTTREPGGIRIAEDIRKVILSKENTMMSGRAEALLYAASRAQHLAEKVQPALSEGKVVLCDRFVDSSLAYQGYGRELGIDEVWNINKFAIGDVLPDLTIFIDIPPHVGLNRVQKSTRKLDRLDLETLEFHEKVYQGYKIIIEKFKDRFVIIDGNNPVETVIEDTLQVIKTYL
ncbi:Thymidylate kinase [Candidatus Izimaplasma bacterium HR1]|uniref:dTMP kinase n=1 Tax=Candidatus Izimoplasma sp. HR1 TaxID=1541959 RepID=UPI0004F844C1|nr:Thymidylate kinase [Candidatus Izimaplasma bacterium HR1]